MKMKIIFSERYGVPFVNRVIKINNIIIINNIITSSITLIYPPPPFILVFSNINYKWMLWPPCHMYVHSIESKWPTGWTFWSSICILAYNKLWLAKYLVWLLKRIWYINLHILKTLYSNHFWHILCRQGGDVKGIVRPKMKIWWLSAYPQGIQDVGGCFFSRTQIKIFNSNRCSLSVI